MGGFEAATKIPKQLGEAAPWLIAIGGHPRAVDAAAGGALSTTRSTNRWESDELVGLLLKADDAGPSRRSQ
jgi:hypothetical protein